ncbi:MAG: helix-hairpin-helix domain-containing protein [Defluviitaleaceae bacterium]|nr:helix-hairpin-helix domain-containing protein [Defluviitaleaceae bacterium]
MEKLQQKLGIKSPQTLKIIAIVFVAVIFVLGVVFVAMQRILSSDPITIISTESPEGAAENTAIEIITEPQMLMIHISGHITNPNVYEFEQGARVIDAVNAAGGLTEYADENSINLADFLYDTQRIIVFGITDNAPHATSGSNANTSSSSAGSLININTATTDQLMTLNNIGESRAQNIINHRTARGGFRNIEELMNVTGIGESIFNGLRDRVTVGGN